MKGRQCALITLGFLVVLAAFAFAQPWGWLGVGIQEISEELSWEITARFGPLEGHGVLVAEVLPATPALAAGFQVGDVIAQVAGRRIWDVKGLQRLTRGLPIGEQMEVVVLRGRSRLTLRARIGTMPDSIAQRFAGERYGLTVRSFSTTSREERGVLKVVAVEAGSPAETAGIKAGDVILKVDGYPVSILQEYAEILSRKEAGRPLRILLERQEKRRLVVLDPRRPGPFDRP
ncbi:MAG: PDZ domain-containing protein [Candidatus Methylomirabilales bacterium]